MELIAFFIYRMTPKDEDPFDIADTVSISEFPNRIDAKIFFALREDGNDHKIELVMVYPGDREVWSRQFSANRYRSHMVLYKHESFPIEASVPGTYAIRLKIDDELMSEYPIEVVKSDS